MKEPALGLARGDVRLVGHDPRWAQLYELAAAELKGCLGQQIQAIEHIGSTAVAGLDSKPIIDLMAAVPSLDLSDQIFLALKQIGYEHRFLDTVAGRLFFVKGPENNRTHNLAICEVGSDFWNAHLAFRDALRADQRLAEQYSALKHSLAQQYPHDRVAYTDAKEAFIISVIASELPRTDQ